MTTYEFIFYDETRMVGDGTGPAEALHDAYLRNGFLPTAALKAIRPENGFVDINPPSLTEEPTRKKGKK